MSNNENHGLLDLNRAGINAAHNTRRLPPSQHMSAEQLRIAALLAPTNGSPYQFNSYLPEELESYHLAVMDFFQTYCQENRARNEVVNLARICLHQDFTALYDHASKKELYKRTSNIYLL